MTIDEELKVLRETKLAHEIAMDQAYQRIADENESIDALGWAIQDIEDIIADLKNE